MNAAKCANFPASISWQLLLLFSLLAEQLFREDGDDIESSFRDPNSGLSQQRPIARPNYGLRWGTCGLTRTGWA
jgi:hypothetical protein